MLDIYELDDDNYDSLYKYVYNSYFWYVNN